jgi:hypothetical protein
MPMSGPTLAIVDDFGMTQPLIIVKRDDKGRRTVHQWPSYAELAEAHWQDWAERGDLPGSEWPAEAPANEFIDDLVICHAIDVIPLIRALVDAAPDEESLKLLGAGPLEDLLRDERCGNDVLDQIERIAALDERFRTALSGGWIGEEVTSPKRDRLLALGFTVPGMTSS